VVVALALGHLAPSFAAAVRDDGWYRALLRWLHGRFRDDGFWRGRWGLLLALVPVVLAVGLVQWLLDGIVFGLPALLFGVAAVFYAWGPRDLDVDVAAVVDAADSTGRAEALARLRPAAAAGSGDGGEEIGRVFIAALRRWFGVLFWFVVLGAVGALLYRLVAIAAEEEPALYLPEGTVDGARRLLGVLDWPVAQLMALSLALVGNFDVVVSAWKAAGGAGLDLATRMLASVGRASVRQELDEDAEYAADAAPPGAAAAAGAAATAVPMASAVDAPLDQALRDAMSLVWRVLLAWLAVLALFVVAGWVN
jgi:AmpE protein